MQEFQSEQTPSEEVASENLVTGPREIAISKEGSDFLIDVLTCGRISELRDLMVDPQQVTLVRVAALNRLAAISEPDVQRMGKLIVALEQTDQWLKAAALDLLERKKIGDEDWRERARRDPSPDIQWLASLGD